MNSSLFAHDYIYAFNPRLDFEWADAVLREDTWNKELQPTVKDYHFPAFMYLSLHKNSALANFEHLFIRCMNMGPSSIQDVGVSSCFFQHDILAIIAQDERVHYKSAELQLCRTCEFHHD